LKIEHEQRMKLKKNLKNMFFLSYNLTKKKKQKKSEKKGHTTKKKKKKYFRFFIIYIANHPCLYFLSWGLFVLAI